MHCEQQPPVLSTKTTFICTRVVVLERFSCIWKDSLIFEYFQEYSCLNFVVDKDCAFEDFVTKTSS